MRRGIVLVSHTKEIPIGLNNLIVQVAKDVPITTAGGLDDGSIGTSMEKILQAINDNPAEELFAFYDLGSAKMNLELAIEMTDKKVQLFDTALVEGAYTAAALLQAEANDGEIQAQLKPLVIK